MHDERMFALLVLQTNPGKRAGGRFVANYIIRKKHVTPDFFTMLVIVPKRLRGRNIFSLISLPIRCFQLLRLSRKILKVWWC